jgi:diguanylate cyclase (GGDEF)-like protein/PAS domain S-box-containing protein
MWSGYSAYSPAVLQRYPAGCELLTLKLLVLGAVQRYSMNGASIGGFEAIDMDIPVDGSATSLGAAPRSLGFFIVNNLEAILQDWEEYACSLAPAAAFSQKTLRDHAKQLLQAIAADMSRPQSLQTQEDKSKGLAPDNSPALKSAGEQHALARIAEQFDLEQLIGEFRAVRGSVLRRWAAQKMRGAGRPEEMTRFNESIDEALAASARHYAHTHASIINSTSDAIVGKTAEGIITSWNPGAERIFGYTAQEAIGQSTRMLFPAEQVNEELDVLARIARGEKAHSFDTVRVRKDGTHVHVSVTVSPITDRHGNVVGASKIARDITERIDADTAIRASEESFRAMANSIPQMAWTARADGFIFWYNQRWYDFTGTTLEQTEGWNWQSVHEPDVLPQVMVEWKAAIAAGQPFEMEFPLRAADGSFRHFLTRAMPIKNASGDVVQWAGTNTDVDELKRAEATLRTNQALLGQTHEALKRTASGNAIIAEALEKTAAENARSAEALKTIAAENFQIAETLNQVLQREIRERTLVGRQLAAAVEQEEGARKASLQDSLTGLSNRVLFNNRLEHGLAQAARHGWMLAVLFVDLNEFKSINDTHGHQAGDAVLKSIAERLTSTTRHEDTVSRYGGDEFLCLLTPLREQKHIEMIAAKILAAVQAPCEVGGRDGLLNLRVGCSIGIAVFPKDGASAAELIRHADAAMYVAKENKSGFAFAR